MTKPYGFSKWTPFNIQVALSDPKRIREISSSRLRASRIFHVPEAVEYSRVIIVWDDGEVYTYAENGFLASNDLEPSLFLAPVTSPATETERRINAIDAARRRSHGKATAQTDNVIASVLGHIALEAVAHNRIGDFIDRGLVLDRLIRECGLKIVFFSDSDEQKTRRPTLDKRLTPCPYDTNRDGDCHRCVNDPGGCPSYRAQIARALPPSGYPQGVEVEEVVPGVQGTPLFSSPEEAEKFREQFVKDVVGAKPVSYERILPASCGHTPKEGDKCAVTDIAGKDNCPETPKWNVIHHGKHLLLCDNCLENWLKGAYDGGQR